MKSKNIIQAISFFCLSIGILSCSSEINNETPTIPAQNAAWVSLDAGSLRDLSGVECNLYIFSKSGSSSYTYEKSVKLNNGAPTQLKFEEEELATKSYRFLFLATPSVTPEISLIKKDETMLVVNDKWNDIMIRSNEKLISGDNYYVVVDKLGSEISSSGTINGNLKRLVGQFVVDVYKVASASDQSGVAVDASKALSVLDRVFKVDMECTGMTRDIVFDSMNNIKDTLIWTTSHIQSFPIVTDNDLKVAVPQEWVVKPAELPLGGARVNGIYCLPSTNKTRLKVTFHYYDTTPVCGVNHTGISPDKCFKEERLTLNLPKESENTTLLNILPNHYTVNKAKIRFDRIIDLDFNGGFEFETGWENEK